MTEGGSPPALNVAVRAWAVQPGTSQRARPAEEGSLPPIRHALIFDTETTTDPSQALLFGAYRYVKVDGLTVTTVAEGLIYADGLPERDPAGHALLHAYVASHKADVDLTYLGVEPNWRLQLNSRRQFVDRWVWHVGYPHNNRLDPATLVMFNAPFDLSRISVGAAEARADLLGGFSLLLWVDDDGNEASWRPRLAVKSLNAKAALKKFRRRERGKHDFAGHILDLRTLAFALTGGSHSLASACAAYQLDGKATTPEFGVISEEALDYCRQDVAATTGLFEALLVDYAAHPIQVQPTKAYSPASVAKGYLRAMGIEPRLRRQPDFTPSLLGRSMAAFYGGRAEIHIRHTPVPVTLVDFTSMYPSVDILLGLWDLVTADHIDAVDVTDEVQQLLDTVTLEDCFDPALWRRLVVIAEIEPDGDVVPVRADYRGDDWSIGVNPLYADQPFCYTLPDLVASKLLCGRTPVIRQATRFAAAGGQQSGLTPVALRGDLPVDPASTDFFQHVVEARQEMKRRNPDHPHNSCLCPDCRLYRFLKVLANSGSYGIYAEMIRKDLPSGTAKTVTVHGPNPAPFTVKSTAVEDPGEFCFPPVAACITGAARLMLALLERRITDAGGTWAFCDTDSMATVSDPDGSLIACVGGDRTLPDGRPAIRALTPDQVAAIQHSFDPLNPYDREAVPEILKAEGSGTCYAISAKRYVISIDADGRRVITKRSLHGLGRYLDPLSPTRERRDADGNLIWVDEAWQWILDAHHNPETPLPDWADLPALSRISVSSTTLYRPFKTWNRGRLWADQVKPFNFALAATVDPFGFPEAVAPERFRLIAPYTSNPDEWTSLEWRNLYDPDGPTYRITTDRARVDEPGTILVQSYGDGLRAHRIQPEYKFNAPNGQPCVRGSCGVLSRRRVDLSRPAHHIGKEANLLDDMKAGIIGSLGEALTDYGYDTQAWMKERVLPALANFSGRELAQMLQTDRRTIDRLRAGGDVRRGLAEALCLAAERLSRPM